MNFNKSAILMLLLSLFFLQGCDIIIGVFKAGFWTAIFLVVVILAAAGYGLYKLMSRR